MSIYETNKILTFSFQILIEKMYIKDFIKLNKNHRLEENKKENINK